MDRITNALSSRWAAGVADLLKPGPFSYLSIRRQVVKRIAELLSDRGREHVQANSITSTATGQGGLMAIPSGAPLSNQSQFDCELRLSTLWPLTRGKGFLRPETAGRLRLELAFGYAQKSSRAGCHAV